MSFVYVLMMDVWFRGDGSGDGGDGDGEDESPKEYGGGCEILGVYTSKAAAISDAGSLRCPWCDSFDDAIENVFSDCYVDNRNEKNPPENGLLIQLGDANRGDGDRVMLYIEKHSLKEEDEDEKHPLKGKEKEDDAIAGTVVEDDVGGDNDNDDNDEDGNDGDEGPMKKKRKTQNKKKSGYVFNL